MPSEGTSLLSMTAQSCGSESRAGQGAMESMGRIHLKRAPHMKIKDLLGPQSPGVGRASASSRRVAKETDSGLVRALARWRECTCKAARILFSPYAPNIEISVPSVLPPDGARTALSIIRASARFAKDASRVEDGSLREFGASYVCLIRYTLPASKIDR